MSIYEAVAVWAGKGSGEKESLRFIYAARRDAKLPAFVRPAALVAISNALMALPAHADAGKIFDFNLTLPIMAGQFLLLMVFLDKFWFGPVGKVLDERDGYIRDQLKKFKASHAHKNQIVRMYHTINPRLYAPLPVHNLDLLHSPRTIYP